MELFIPAVALAALAKKAFDFVRYLLARDWNGSLSQLLVSGAGIGVIFLAAQTDFANEIGIGRHTLGNVGGWSLVFVGIVLASSASAVLYDIPKALDNTQSAAIPSLLPPGPTPPGVTVETRSVP